MKHVLCAFLVLSTLWNSVYTVKLCTECPVIVSREEWGALPASQVETLEQPIGLVIIQHTVVFGPCDNDDACAEIARNIQQLHFNRKFWDIGMSFLVGGNGKVYECRGWDHVGAHTLGYNDRSYGISFIGDFNVDTPTPPMLEAAQKLIQCGVDEGHISEDYNLVGHRQLRPTESPGDKLYDLIVNWPHFLADVSQIATA